MGLEKIVPENVEQVGYNQPHGNFANRWYAGTWLEVGRDGLRWNRPNNGE